MSLETVSENVDVYVILREEVPIINLEPLFKYPMHYVHFANNLRGVDRAYVHIQASGSTGEVSLLGISRDPEGKDPQLGHFTIGNGAIPFLEERLDQIKSLLPSYEQSELHAVVRGPNDNSIIADSRN